MSNIQKLEDSDPIIARLIKQERIRQQSHLELIASENFTSIAVMEAQGSSLLINMLRGFHINDIMVDVNM